MLEEILDIRNVQKAFKQVTANKGAGGIDGMQTDELRDYLNVNCQVLRKEILEGNYRPKAVRKVEIPKAEGGTRMKGNFPITVMDLGKDGVRIRLYCRRRSTLMKGMNGWWSWTLNIAQ